MDSKSDNLWQILTNRRYLNFLAQETGSISLVELWAKPDLLMHSAKVKLTNIVNC